MPQISDPLVFQIPCEDRCFGGPPNTSFLDAEIGSPTTDPHKVFGGFWKTKVKGTRMSMVLSKRIILGAGWANPLKSISQNGKLPYNRGENKKKWNHHPDYNLYTSRLDTSPKKRS